MFVGTFKHSIDTKGRVNVPKRFLDHFRDPNQVRTFFVTQGFDGCLSLYTQESFEDVVRRVRENSVGDAQVRAFQRRLYGKTRELEIDAAGRVLLPADLRELAGLSDEALFIGVDDRIELWSPERFSKQDGDHAARFEENAKGIFRA